LERHRELALKREACAIQFVSETGFVSALQKARPERPMHLQGAAQDLLPNCVLRHLFSASSADLSELCGFPTKARRFPKPGLRQRFTLRRMDAAQTEVYENVGYHCRGASTPRGDERCVSVSF